MNLFDIFKKHGGRKSQSSKNMHFRARPEPIKVEVQQRKKTKAKRIPRVVKAKRLRERRMHKLAACRPSY